MVYVVLLLILALVIWVSVNNRKKYKKTEYYLQTHNSYSQVHSDKGSRGEYYIYESISKLEGYKKFLFNLYIPKETDKNKDADTSKDDTTELDVVMLHETGIYVFESKNYGGQIFGDEEADRDWIQKLPGKRGTVIENKLYNPIWQNKGHIYWLRKFINGWKLPVYSYVVFSDRSSLKGVTLTSGNHVVVRRSGLLSALRRNAANVSTSLSKEKIDKLYEKLYPHTQTDDNVKKKHIENIKKKYAKE